MAFKCIIEPKVEEFKKALKDKDIKMSDLLNLDHKPLVDKLTPFVGKDAESLATLFEEKRILKNQMVGLKNAVQKATRTGRYSPESIAAAKKALTEFRAKQQERIFSPAEGESYLGGIVNKIMGQETSPEVAKKVFDLSQKADDLRTSTQSEFGPGSEYFKAREELQKYVDSQKPTTLHKDILTNLTSIFRNFKLMNPAIPIKVFASGEINTAIESMTRRAGSPSVGGPVPELADAKFKAADKFFKETGLTVSQMESLDDVHMLGTSEHFELPSTETPGAKVAKGVRKVAAVAQKIAIDLEHKGLFNKYYNKNFFDAANITSGKMAAAEGLKGEQAKTRSVELFNDASQIEPKTPEGRMLRAEAQKQAARATSTNDTVISTLTLNAKRMLNNWIPGVRVGDLISPIAKMPANLISNGLDNAGFGSPMAVYDLFKGRELMGSEDVGEQLQGLFHYHRGMQRIARIGGTLATAALVIGSMKKSDFKSDRYGEHFMRIGGLWVNTEYVSFISPAMAGMAEARIQGSQKSWIESYLTGALSGAKKLPVIDEIEKLKEAITSSHLAKGAGKYISGFVKGAIIPSFINNLFKDRPINRLFFGARGIRTQNQVNKDESK